MYVTHARDTGDGRPSFEFVVRQLLHELCPCIRRRFDLLEQVLAVSRAMEHLKVMRANELVKSLLCFS